MYFFVKTSPADKQAIDEQIARMIFATNSSFRTVDHPEFQEMVKKLRPGYTAPSRRQLSDSLLPKVYDKVKNEYAQVL